MDKIKEAQELADKLIDEATIKQVGDNKGALKDTPEKLEKSEEDIDKAVEMKENTKILNMVDNLKIHLGEKKEIKVSDVPKDKQEIFKINRGKAREKGGALTKAERGGKPVKESNQTKIAQQKDTLFDNLSRVVQPKTDKKTSLNPEPTSEGKITDKILNFLNKRSQSKLLAKAQKYGKKRINIVRKANPKGNIFQKRRASLNAAMKD